MFFFSSLYQVINLGNGRPFLLKDFISLVEKCVGKEAMIEILPHQPGDVDRTCADISKARELLGYSPKVPFEEGIRRTAEWFRDATEEGLFDEPVPMDASAAVTERDRSLSLLTVNSEDSSTPDAAQDNGPPALGPGVAYGPKTDEIQEIVFSPQRVKRSSTSSYNHKRHVFIHKISSDLELSSYVQKAPVQVRNRVTRIL